MRFEARRPVRVEFTKWDGRPHWAYDGVYLGCDEHGDWLGHPARTLMARPGREFADTVSWLTLVPIADAPWLATFNSVDHHLETYIDITTPATWTGDVLHAIDLDLDVVHPRDGRDPFIDDEDEFALHQVEFGYPPEVITTAESAVRDLLTAVTARRPPFDGSAEPWLNLLNQEPMGEVI
jgi:hypothetical protein